MNANMRWIVMAVAMVSWMGVSSPLLACGGYGDSDDVRDAICDDARVAQEATARLRAQGQRGLAVLLSVHRAKSEAVIRGELSADDARLPRLEAAIDAVGGQRTCLASRLFWHTDIEAAKAESARTGKPIVSLRLLGKLTDELSCANSRFFRSTLYANAEVSEFLRNKCVLHWQSVRPVPVVTVDFGDGRTLKRTVTGNSIHYVLDADGRVVDGLPGLYGPKAFLRELGEAVSLAHEMKGLATSERDARVRQYHDEQTRTIAENLRVDLEQLGKVAGTSPPDGLDDDTWRQIAELHQGDAMLDAASAAVIRGQLPPAGPGMVVLTAGSVVAQGLAKPGPQVGVPAEVAARVTISKGLVEDPILRVMRSFEVSIALDTVRNEYQLHRAIHQWIADGGVTLDTPVDQLNERVYAELFLTPSSDPWLGLFPGEAYTALDNGGLVIR